MMGGVFSTRWFLHRKKTRVDQCRSFSVADLVGSRPPTAGQVARFEWRGGTGKTVKASIAFVFETASRVRLDYRWGEEGRPVVVPFDLISLPTPRGGTRYLAVCPLVVNDVPCGRRVAKLYLPPSSRYFGCRSCHRLTYRSRQGHDPRVTRLLRSGTLNELGATLDSQPLPMLGLILAAVAEEQRQLERALEKFTPKPKPRRRKPR